MDESKLAEKMKTLGVRKTRYNLWEIYRTTGKGVIPSELTGTFTTERNALDHLNLFLLEKHNIPEKKTRGVKRGSTKAN